MRNPRIIIVGAGMSGICQAITLAKAGFTDVTILEKAQSVGGTWRENRYPGLHCDVPSHMYQYSFAMSSSWTRLYSPGPEIRRYFTGVAEDFNLAARTRYGVEVTAAHHDGVRWNLTTNTGEEVSCDFVIFATGILHHPSQPDFAGIDDFGGKVFHSARWDDSVDVRGKRVGVIGNGSTGVQIVSALAGTAAHTTMFQRTPQWVFKMPNPPVLKAARFALAKLPFADRIAYGIEYRLFENFSEATVKDGVKRRTIQALCRANLSSVRDLKLRKKLTPDYQPMCRRLIMHPDFYERVQRPDVTVETNAVTRFTKTGVQTADGTLHELDIVVLATGFKAHSYLLPTTVTTSTGASVDHAWANGPRAYLSVAVADIPNFHLLLGPHSPIGNFSLVQIAEHQARYITRRIERWRAGKYDNAAPTTAAVDAHYAYIKAGLPSTVWATGCTSWYLGADGLPELWPYSPQEYMSSLAKPDSINYLEKGTAACPVTH